MAAVKGGQGDAAPLPAHIFAKLVADGDARLIGWVHEHKPWQLGGLFTPTRNVQERRPVVEAFVSAYQKASRAYHAAFNARDAAGQRVFGPAAAGLLPPNPASTKAPRPAGPR